MQPRVAERLGDVRAGSVDDGGERCSHSVQTAFACDRSIVVQPSFVHGVTVPGAAVCCREQFPASRNRHTVALVVHDDAVNRAPGESSEACFRGLDDVPVDVCSGQRECLHWNGVVCLLAGNWPLSAEPVTCRYTAAPTACEVSDQAGAIVCAGSFRSSIRRTAAAATRPS